LNNPNAIWNNASSGPLIKIAVQYPRKNLGACTQSTGFEYVFPPPKKWSSAKHYFASHANATPHPVTVGAGIVVAAFAISASWAKN
jgi:hypothetical protein